MIQMYLKHIVPCGIIVFLVCILITMAACTTSTVNNPVPTQPAFVQGTSIASTPGIGPTIILTPTKIPGGSEHSQLVTLPDRILSISNVSKKAGTDSSSLAIDLTITIKNTSAKTINNDATYFQLTSADGDAFGLQPGVASNFFGVITSRNSRSGTIIFQVPSGAVNGIRLLYRPEFSKETIFVPLNFT
jgi:hypothetical protein